MWKRQFASDGFCSRGAWPNRQTSDSQGGCCSPGNSRGGGDPGPGQPAQHWQKSLREDFKAFGALHGSTPTDRRTFGVDRLVWTEVAHKEEVGSAVVHRGSVGGGEVHGVGAQEPRRG